MLDNKKGDSLTCYTVFDMLFNDTYCLQDNFNDSSGPLNMLNRSKDRQTDAQEDNKSGFGCYNERQLN